MNGNSPEITMMPISEKCSGKKAITILTGANFQRVVDTLDLEAYFLLSKISEYSTVEVWLIIEDSLERLNYAVAYDDTWNKYGTEYGYSLKVSDDYDKMPTRTFIINENLLMLPIREPFVDSEKLIFDYEYESFLDYSVEEMGYGQLYNVAPLALDAAHVNRITLIEFVAKYF